MLKAFTRACTKVCDKFLPDAYLFAVVLTAVCFILCLILTDAGVVGTLVAWGGGMWKLLAFTAEMATIMVFGYLYHTPLKADVTIVQAYAADEAGNLIFRRTQRNFCDTMCLAGETVIASIATPIKKKGEIDPDAIMVPGVVVDYLVQEG